LFSGDTLFNAGAGNCHSTGRPDLLYDTFATQLARLPDTTRLFPGHEYLARNLEFTLDREPDNAAARALLAKVKSTPAQDIPVTTLGEEKQVNTFFRLHNPRIIAQLRERFADLPEFPDPKSVFLKLRELRNAW
jgi:hydroxyacylglutathione hydrolase